MGKSLSGELSCPCDRSCLDSENTRVQHIKAMIGLIIPPAYEVCHGGIIFSSFLCVCVSVNNFRVRSITLKPHDIFS